MEENQYFQSIKSCKHPILWIILGVSILLTQFVNCGDPEPTSNGVDHPVTLECDTGSEDCEEKKLELRFTTPEMTPVPWVVNHYLIEVSGSCNVGLSQDHAIHWEIRDPQGQFLSSSEHLLNVCQTKPITKGVCDRGHFYLRVPFVFCDGAGQRFNILAIPNPNLQYTIKAGIFALDPNGQPKTGVDSFSSHEVTVVTAPSP